MGITKEQLLASIELIKQYVDNIGVTQDLSENIELVDKVLETPQPLQYLGTDANNNIGLYYFPQETIAKPGINQITTLSVTNGQCITIDTLSLNTSKFIIQVYKFNAGENDISEIVKVFDNANEENFIHSENVDFNTECHIKNSYEYKSTLNSASNFYETEEITVSEFLELSSIKGTVV